MADVPKDMRSMVFGKGAKWHARSMMVLNWLGLLCLIVGIVADAINTTLGLETIHWFIMTIAFWLWGLASWLCAYYAAKEG